MYRLIKKLKRNTEYLNYGRDRIIQFVNDYIKEGNKENVLVRVLDIGCGTGVDTLNVKQVIKNGEFFGVETHKPYIDILESKAIRVASVNIENEKLPFDDGFFDIVMANQIIEHTKEIFWIISEVARVLKPGGIFIIGVPNLASLHNRVLLLLGKQPSSIRPLSAHVRGFTRGGMKECVEYGKFFHMEKFKGSNFYPFPSYIARPLSTFFPGLSVGIFFVFKRTNKEGNYLLGSGIEEFETNYFKGE